MAGHSEIPLAKKLGIKPGIKAFFHSLPESVLAELKPALTDVELTRSLSPELDFILSFVRSKSELTKDFPVWKKHLSKSGCLWIAWPKKTSGLETTLSDIVVRDIGLKASLVDIKVRAVDAQWSGLKFVYRKGGRKRMEGNPDGAKRTRACLRDQ
jgi:hypothetical protein